ncbi:MAG: hypothetical protein QXI90_01610 [Thermofilum sp.]
MPLVVATAERGHERAVLRDLLDALFPYDHDVKGTLCGWNICIETSLHLEDLRKLLHTFPIRNLIAVRYVLAALDPLPAGELARELSRVLADSGLKVRKIRVRLSSRIGWSQEYFAAIKKALLDEGLVDEKGWLIAVEERDNKVTVSALLQLRKRELSRSAPP